MITEKMEELQGKMDKRDALMGDLRHSLVIKELFGSVWEHGTVKTLIRRCTKNAGYMVEQKGDAYDVKIVAGDKCLTSGKLWELEKTNPKLYQSIKAHVIPKLKKEEKL